MTRFLELGFAPELTACSADPASDGYFAMRNGMPFHLHRDATPDEWRALIDVLADADQVEITEWVEPVADPAQAMAGLRAERDRLLAASDFTQLADAPLSLAARAAWAEYRQTLRDMPAEFAVDPASAIFPEMPA